MQDTLDLYRQDNFITYLYRCKCLSFVSFFCRVVLMFIKTLLCLPPAALPRASCGVPSSLRSWSSTEIERAGALWECPQFMPSIMFLVGDLNQSEVSNLQRGTTKNTNKQSSNRFYTIFCPTTRPKGNTALFSAKIDTFRHLDYLSTLSVN